MHLLHINRDEYILRMIGQTILREAETDPKYLRSPRPLWLSSVYAEMLVLFLLLLGAKSNCHSMGTIQPQCFCPTKMVCEGFAELQHGMSLRVLRL